MVPSFPVPSFGDLVAVARGAELRGDPAVRISDAVCDSRLAGPGSVFFCVPGGETDGHRFAPDAAAAGARGLVVERWLDLTAPQIKVPSVRAAMGPMSALVFGHPSRAMRTVGITGTNGKTTITYLLEAVFGATGITPGVIGTTGARIAEKPQPLERTTPEAPDLHRLLAEMRDAGVRGVAMEVSSHALEQERVGGVVFDVAVFTNLSRDHLDYHGTMKEYFDAKATLFTPAHAVLGVVNIDDPWGVELVERSSIPVTTFAVDAPEADLRPADVRVDATGISFRVGDLAVRSPLRGAFNVSNCLGALAAARALGLDDRAVAAGMAELVGVPGRMEPIDAGQDFLVVVDYAHTPDSILTVLRAARPLTPGQVICVFGCGGDRDRAKRPLMGGAATSNADLTIVTSDNPRSEDPLAIIGEIEPGAREGGGAFVVEPDRREAIRLALRSARAGDVVVIAGKGHERYQETGGRRTPFDDREVVREGLRAIAGEAR